MDKVAKVMREYREGNLRSGSGSKVRERKQALAVALAEKRKAGKKDSPFQVAKG